MASSFTLFSPLLYNHSLRFSLHHPLPQFTSSRLCTLTSPLRFRCSTAIERTEKKLSNQSQIKNKVRLRLRLTHQVEFGEHVAVLGSTTEFGKWTKRKPMRWTEAGWVCELELRGGESSEFKFVITTNEGKGIVWEEGENRVVRVPESGVYDLACRWNETREVLDLLRESEGDGEGFEVRDDGVVAEGEGSAFVEQWQGRDVSFMRSNEHRGREIERRWDVEGLDGLVLELVEGDKRARNWRGKVSLSFYLCGMLKRKDD